MQEVIDSIRDAINKECWLPALAMALTLPDICGQIEYPDLIHNNGKRNVGAQYKTWFHEHAESYFVDDAGFDENGYAKRPFLTADMCYNLRCELLHAGNDDVSFEYGETEERFEYDYDFELRVNACNSYGEHWITPQCGEVALKHVHVCVDVASLCECLCDEAEKFFHDVNDEVIAGHTIKIMDIAQNVRL